MSTPFLFSSRSGVPSALYFRWWAGMVLSGGLISLGLVGLTSAWAPGYALGWSLQAGLVLAYVFGILRLHLAQNRRSDGEEVLPAFGIGNTLTLVRGVCVALLAGFLFAPRPPGLLAWLPALLYLFVGVADFLDGYLARVYDRVTLLGEKLDVAYDALATLVAVMLAVHYGQLPPVYIVLGVVYYLFHFHMALRRRRGRSVYPLPPSAHRRFFAGCHYGFLAVILAPVFTPPITVLAGGLFGLPIIAGFVRDWLVAVGRLNAGSGGYRRRWGQLQAVLLQAMPVAIRGGTVAAGLVLVFQGLSNPEYGLVEFAAAGLAVPALGSIVLGWMGRVGALGVLAAGCADLLVHGFGPVNAVVILGSISLLLLGTGAWSCGSPEDALLLHRRGAPRASRTPRRHA